MQRKVIPRQVDSGVIAPTLRRHKTRIDGGQWFQDVFGVDLKPRLAFDSMDRHRNVFLRPNASQRIFAAYKVHTFFF